MKTMTWLLRREFWENKGSMFWAPLIVGALMVVALGGMAIYGASMGEFENRVTVDGQLTSVTSHFNTFTPEKKQEIAKAISATYLLIAAPLFLMMSIIAFFYCLGALHDERRDRSILFWKSLPISDTQTVLAKVITATIVAPLITIAVGSAVSVLLLAIFGAAFASLGLNLFPLVLSNPDFYLMPLQLLGLLPVYILWALPSAGWLLMVSAWAKSKVFLWAVGVPLVTIAVIAWGNYLLKTRLDLDWLVQNVVARGLVGFIPGTWMPLSHADMAQFDGHLDGMGTVFSTSWATLATPQAWFGIAAGVAMIVAAIRLRRWKDEG